MVNFRRFVTASFLWLISIGIVKAADADSIVVTIDFPVSRAEVLSNFGDNAQRLLEIAEVIDELKSSDSCRIVGVKFRGNASPEGSLQINRKLSASRMRALESYVRNRFDLPDSLVSEEDLYVAWDAVASRLEQSDYTFKDEALAIIRGAHTAVHFNGRDYDSRLADLRRIDGGRAWQTMLREVFSKVRNASVVFVTQQPDVQPEPMTEPIVEPIVEEPIVEEIAEEPVEEYVSPCEQKHFYLKTNLAGWALLIGNIGVEFETACHWSVALHGYYSALDYFRSDVKFRTLAIQPELRYWLAGAPQNGWFVAAHLGLAWWNYALGGDYRRQDHKGHTPAYGGGLNFGYRKSLGQHWRVEFSAGAGVYGLNYDKFYNVNNGAQVENSIRRTWVGLDNLAVTFAYSFNLN